MDIIFKKTKTGAVQQWQQEIDGDKYRTISGQVGGKLTVTEWTVAKAKNVGRANQTTPEQQALAEVEANYVKKLKSGYVKTLDCVNDERPFFEPMLARKYEGELPQSRDIFSQPKLDGVRALTGGKVGSRLQTRTNAQDIVSCPHIIDALKTFYEKRPSIVLDGELYNHELRDDFNKIISLVRRRENLTEDDYNETRSLVQYHIYDCFDEQRPNLFFSERRNLVSEVIYDFFDDFPFITLVNTIKCSGTWDIDTEYEHVLMDGYEGQILRVDGPYENKRSKYLYKRKTFIDREFPIVDIEPGTGSRSMVASSVVLRNDDQRLFRAGVNGSFAASKDLLDNKHLYVGGQCTVRYFRTTPDGVPRFPKAVAFYQGERDM